jgi:hypothetical protein
MIKYTCSKCGNRVDLPERAEAPECCQMPMKTMEPLSACELTDTPEHSRIDKSGEPCDDGRGH